MEEKTIKFKRVDTGKQWIAGSIKQGKYGPQIGMKMTPELRAYLDSVQMGGWLNFNLYEPYKKDGDHEQAKRDAPAPKELDDSIPFSLVLPLLAAGALAINCLAYI